METKNKETGTNSLRAGENNSKPIMSEGRPDWEELALKYPECRCFIEFAYENYGQFRDYLIKTIEEATKEASP